MRGLGWTGPAGAGAETVMDEKLQEVARALAEKVHSGTATAS